MTRARDAASNAHAATYVHPTGAGNQHIPAAGAAGQLLQYASAGTATWATVSSDPALPSVPNWASPTNTYTASGTWSKGSLADSAFVWFYLLGGGGGGNGASGEFYNFGGSGGGAVLIHATAAVLNGATYVIGAGAAGSTASSASSPTETKVTLSDGRIFSTTNVNNRKAQTIGTSGTTTNFQQTVPDSVVITIKEGVTEGGVTMTDSTAFFSESPSGPSGGGTGRFYSVFGGGSGKGTSYDPTSGGAGATSTYAGTGGTGQAGPSGGSGFTDGSYPGGGGGSRNAYSSGGTSAGGAGANGNLRVYHV